MPMGKPNKHEPWKQQGFCSGIFHCASLEYRQKKFGCLWITSDEFIFLLRMPLIKVISDHYVYASALQNAYVVLRINGTINGDAQGIPVLTRGPGGIYVLLLHMPHLYAHTP